MFLARVIAFLLIVLLPVQASPLYRIETLAGTSSTGDGRPAVNAVLIQPEGLATDRSGNLYIADAGDHRVRKIGADGVIRTVAGNGRPGSSDSQLNSPYGLTLDAGGNLFIADLGNGLVRRLGVDGSLLIAAGGGSETPSTGSLLQATKAKLVAPRDVVIDRAGNFLIADFGGHRIYSVTPAGYITVVAGTGEAGPIRGATPALSAALSFPSALAIDSAGAVLIADSGSRRVRRLYGGMVSTLTDRAGKEIEFGTLTGLAADAMGRIYVADGGSKITMVSPAGEVSTANIPGVSVAVTPFFDVITSSERSVQRLSGARLETIAGSGANALGDGRSSSEWRFSAPSSALRDDYGSLWIADTGNGRVRKITAAGDLSTVTTQLGAPVSLAMDSKGRIYAGDRASGGVYRFEGGIPRLIVKGDNRAILPAAIAFDSADNLLIADSLNNVIRRVGPDGSMTVLAGGGRETGDGQALQVRLSTISGIAQDATGTIWFSEAGAGRIRKLTGTQVTTLAGTEFMEPRGMRFDKAGNLWVADAGGHRIVCINPRGEWTPSAGSGDRGFSGDGALALAATLNTPSDVFPESDGGVIIADSANDRIRRIRPEPSETPAPVPLAPPALTLPSVSFVHAATMRETALAPGQLAYVMVKNAVKPEVTIGNVAATVVATASDRLTIQIPSSLQTGFAEALVKLNGEIYGKTAVEITSSVPGILANAEGQALALNDDGSVNGVNQSAGRGSVVTLFVTGEGPAESAVTAEMGGYAAEIVWKGPAPGLPGLFQLNVQTPGGFAPSGRVAVVLTFAGLRTQAGVTIVSR